MKPQPSLPRRATKPRASLSHPQCGLERGHACNFTFIFKLLWQGMRMIHVGCLLLCWMALPIQGLEIFDPEEVEYIHSNTTATVGGSVILDCGSTMPTIFIWGFTKQGTDNNVAVAYNYGQGPKIQSQSSHLGLIQVQVNTSALVIEELQSVAEGMYTCQALYDTDNGAKITFYFTRLDMVDD